MSAVQVTPARLNVLAVVLTILATALAPLTSQLNYAWPFREMHGGPGAAVVTAPVLAAIVFASFVIFIVAKSRAYGTAVLVISLLPGGVAAVVLLWFVAVLYGL